ncbi:zinc finger protein 175-like, partial [Homarus americanus]|uniref:zinc finger protein 175-like n=1 Tax=Homarus americanus TaxID=6706 RepID=UPI001C4381DF
RPPLITEQLVVAGESRHESVGDVAANRPLVWQQQAANRPLGKQQASRRLFAGPQAAKRPLGNQHVAKRPLGNEQAAKRPLGKQQASSRLFAGQQAANRPPRNQEAATHQAKPPVPKHKVVQRKSLKKPKGKTEKEVGGVGDSGGGGGGDSGGDSGGGEVCLECEQEFGTKYEFELHIKEAHLGVAPWRSEYHCQDCNQAFAHKISLNVHRMFKHGAPRRYQCDKCDYEGPRLYHLKRHMKVHTNERQFVCTACNKGFKSAQSYKNHAVIHTNDGRFVCEVCSKSYNQKGIFEDHQRSHSQDRRYSCDYCKVAFKTYKHVACHIRAVHLDDKRFICDLCGIRHMSGANLKTHMKTHKNASELPYVFHCNVCDATFRGFNGLATHMRIIHAADADAGAGKLKTPHPTRRPNALKYGIVDAPKVDEDADAESVCVESDDLTLCKIKPEDMEFEV